MLTYSFALQKVVFNRDGANGGVKNFSENS